MLDDDAGRFFHVLQLQGARGVMQGTEPIIINAALAVMGLLLLAALGSLWHLNLKVTEMAGILSNEDFGVVAMLRELRRDVKDLAERVGELERGA